MSDILSVNLRNPILSEFFLSDGSINYSSVQGAANSMAFLSADGTVFSIDTIVENIGEWNFNDDSDPYFLIKSMVVIYEGDPIEDYEGVMIVSVYGEVG